LITFRFGRKRSITKFGSKLWWIPKSDIEGLLKSIFTSACKLAVAEGTQNLLEEEEEEEEEIYLP